MTKKKKNDKAAAATESFWVYVDRHTYPLSYSMGFNGRRGNASAAVAVVAVTTKNKHTR